MRIECARCGDGSSTSAFSWISASKFTHGRRLACWSEMAHNIQWSSNGSNQRVGTQWETNKNKTQKDSQAARSSGRRGSFSNQKRSPRFPESAWIGSRHKFLANLLPTKPTACKSELRRPRGRATWEPSTQTISEGRSSGCTRGTNCGRDPSSANTDHEEPIVGPNQTQQPSLIALGKGKKLSVL